MESINRREMAPQPFVFTRARTSRAELPSAIGEGLGKVFAYVQQHGVGLAGPPLVRYVEMGPGLMTIEIGFPVVASAPGDGAVECGALSGGTVTVAVHVGPYDQLGDTYVEMETWMQANALRPAGAPWESYVTDPADVPNPAEWRTEVYWPVAAISEGV